MCSYWSDKISWKTKSYKISKLRILSFRKVATFFLKYKINKKFPFKVIMLIFLLDTECYFFRPAVNVSPLKYNVPLHKPGVKKSRCNLRLNYCSFFLTCKGNSLLSLLIELSKFTIVYFRIFISLQQIKNLYYYYFFNIYFLL